MTKKWFVKFKAKSPITHNDEVSLSTTTMFRRIKMAYNDRIIEVPVYTGNAWRGLLRRAAAHHFVKTIGLENISPDLYHILYDGGFLSKGASGNINIGVRRKIRQFIPYLSVFGGATGDLIIEGRLSVGILFPIGQETEPYTGVKSSHSVFEFLDTIFYTHRDDYEKDEEGDTVQMKYEVECLIPGTQLVSTIVLRSDQELEISAFGTAIHEWMKRGYIGGKNATGHGVVDFEMDGIPSPRAYEGYLHDRADEIRKFVESLG